MSTFALIAAAGSGSRMAGGALDAAPKQYLPLAGKPVLWHALRGVCVAPVEMVFVVLAPGDRAFERCDWSAFGGRLQPLYCGGASRAESVHNGLVAAMAAVDADDWVLVHDAARPCLPRADLERLLGQCAGDAVGGLLALPVADTVKRAAQDEAGVLRATASEARSQLWLAQTPQMFRAGLLAQALHTGNRALITDEASAIEQLGLKPRLVPGSRDNIKLTYPEDLGIAAAILKGG
ncbi:MAG: 2-C-methyl-D-erythritol 4-phosphate cytidylyltransferase [Betaproteobacteria bacterium]|nr:2-C-methyl-D-erythritol 4-phosphate cytidylyltransferase [Betaproteobacteria bacterium]